LTEQRARRPCGRPAGQRVRDFGRWRSRDFGPDDGERDGAAAIQLEGAAAAPRFSLSCTCLPVLAATAAAMNSPPYIKLRPATYLRFRGL